MTPEPLFFDCHASYGPYKQKHREARWTLEHLIEDLDLAGIAGALVHHHLALTYDPMVGNRQLVADLAPHRGRLFPCWEVFPAMTGEFPAPRELARELRDHDVRAVRVDPWRWDVPLRERFWGELRDVLLELDVLCVLPVPPRYGHWFEPAERLLTLFKDHKTLLVGHRWGTWHQATAAMDSFPNLHMEFSSFQANRAVEAFAGRYGAQRCLFGTNLPFKAPGAARGFFDFSLLPEEQVALMAGENLRRLLGGQGPRSVPAPGPWHDAITAAVRAGGPVPCPVLDAHCHIGHDGGHMLGSQTITLRGDADGMIELTRRAGIDKTAIMSWAGPLNLDTDLGNTIVEHAVARYPDEFIGLATVNPEYDNPEKIERIIDHYHRRLGFPGLKTFTPCQTIDYDDPLLHPWLQYANDHKLYMVFDPKNGAASTACARNLARRYPDLSIHIDHCGQSWEFAKWAVEMMREFPNFWAQLNFTDVTNGVIEYLVEQVGAERVLFGTDAPMRDPRPQVSWLVYTRLSEAHKRLIFGENFAGILRRAGVMV